MLSESFPGSSEYGLGIVVQRSPTVYGHDGKYFGLLSSLFYVPRFDLSLATTVNASDGIYDLLYSDYTDQVISVLEARIP